jgi:hypothetical protein
MSINGFSINNGKVENIDDSADPVTIIGNI